MSTPVAATSLGIDQPQPGAPRKGQTAVIFDLDGTLVDTAPDLIAALNELLAEEGRAAVPACAVRATVSHGARVMISQAFALGPADPRATSLEQALITAYRKRITASSRLFPGMAGVLEALEAEQIPWGVVTNKPSALTDALLDGLGLSRRAAVVVSGDTLKRAKPHPLPIRHAAAAMACSPAQCWCIGDARRDLDAALGAGARGLVALFGYLHAGDRPCHWGAHGLVQQPAEILEWVRDPRMSPP